MAIVTEEMKQAGNDIASAMMDASIAKSMGGIGSVYDSWESYIKENCSHQNWDLISDYVEGRICSVEGIYLAMERAKNDHQQQTR